MLIALGIRKIKRKYLMTKVYVIPLEQQQKGPQSGKTLETRILNGTIMHQWF
jgi:hypothetical protein